MSAAAATPLKYLTVPARAKHTASGLGDSGHGWQPVAAQLSEALPHVKWVLPHAPSVPVTANGGELLSLLTQRLPGELLIPSSPLEQGAVMPAWFDVKRFGDPTAPEDAEGITRSTADINALVDAEVAGGIPSERVVVGGFSQGAGIALNLGLTSPRKLAGIVQISGRFFQQETAIKALSPHLPTLRILVAHGTADRIIPFTQGGLKTREVLVGELGLGESERPEGGKVTFKAYEGLGHSVNDQELEELRVWLEGAVGNA